MIRRRAEIVGIKTRMGNHTFRETEGDATDGQYDRARATGLHDHRGNNASLDEVEWIGI
jgi:hypothetical protein